MFSNRFLQILKEWVTLMFAEEYHSYVDTAETGGHEKDLQRAAVGTCPEKWGDKGKEKMGLPTSAKVLLSGGRKS